MKLLRVLVVSVCILLLFLALVYLLFLCYILWANRSLTGQADLRQAFAAARTLMPAKTCQM